MSSRRVPDLPAAGETCRNHSFERAERICRQCGLWYCDQCVVTPWGPRKPALCVACAVNRGGVRSTSGHAPVRSEREIKQLERQGRDDLEGGFGQASSGAAAALRRAAPLVTDGRDQDASKKRSLFRRLRPD
jgi:hypothetical protein